MDIFCFLHVLVQSFCDNFHLPYYGRHVTSVRQGLSIRTTLGTRLVQTSPYVLGLYKKTSVRYFSVQTSRSVNKKLILNIMVFTNLPCGKSITNNVKSSGFLH
jgi:hypothetical protein